MRAQLFAKNHTENQEQNREKRISYAPPVSIETMRDFETKNGLELPEELIAFYTTICNGCTMIDIVKTTNLG